MKPASWRLMDRACRPALSDSRRFRCSLAINLLPSRSSTKSYWARGQAKGFRGHKHYDRLWLRPSFLPPFLLCSNKHTVKKKALVGGSSGHSPPRGDENYLLCAPMTFKLHRLCFSLWGNMVCTCTSSIWLKNSLSSTGGVGKHCEPSSLFLGPRGTLLSSVLVNTHRGTTVLAHLLRARMIYSPPATLLGGHGCGHWTEEAGWHRGAGVGGISSARGSELGLCPPGPATPIPRPWGNPWGFT